jgi:hypothetical protein
VREPGPLSYQAHLTRGALSPGGGEYDHNLWSAELPSDSQLIVYLAAAFLKAPMWVFPESEVR